MKVFGILALLLGLAVVAFTVKTQLDGTMGASKQGHTQPRRQLDNVREAAKTIEDDAQKRVDESLKKADSQ